MNTHLTTKTIILETPIVRGEQTITEVTLTKPNTGALRGASVSGLVNMDINTLILVLPRITTPTLTAADVASIDTADLAAIGIQVSFFFLSKSAQADFPTT